ncbi:MAG: transposase, partial [Candidatus Omnitrophota bacterium]
MQKIKTRRNTNRIPQYDYSTPGQYFLTICIEDRQQILGAVENDKMILNDTGKIADFSWREIINHFTGIELDQHIIMPNHIHGIINIIVGARSPRPNNDNNDTIIGRGNRAPTIGNIIAYFKYQTTKQINEFQNVPGRKIWQRNYYDHIIRNDKSLTRIREYIINNPATWN